MNHLIEEEDDPFQTAETQRICAAAKFAQDLNRTIPPPIEETMEETFEDAIEEEALAIKKKRTANKKRAIEKEEELEEPERKKLKLKKEDEEEDEVDWRSLPWAASPAFVHNPQSVQSLPRVSADFLASLAAEDKTRLGLAEPRIHRERLLGLLEDARFTNREKVIFFALFCTYGTRERVLAVFDQMEHYKYHPSADKIKAFIRDRSVPEITMLDKDTFAPALIGISDPSADFYSWAHSVPVEQLTVDNMLNRVTACQLNLDEGLQIQARANFLRRFPVGPFDGFVANYVRARDIYYARLGSEQCLLLNPGLKPLITGRPYGRKDIED